MSMWMGEASHGHFFKDVQLLVDSNGNGIGLNMYILLR